MAAVTYTEFRGRLANVLDDVVENHEVVYVTRRGHPDVAVIAADELSSLMETVHLLRSPKNAMRLLSAIRDSYTGENMQEMTVDEIVEAAKSPAPSKRVSTRRR